MKISTDLVKAFTPLTVTLVIESQEELDFWRRVALSNITVPEAAFGYSKDRCDFARNRYLKMGGDILDNLFRALKPF